MPFLLQNACIYDVAKEQETLLGRIDGTQQLTIDGSDPLAVIMPRHGRFVLAATRNAHVQVNGHDVKIKILRHGDMIQIGMSAPFHFYHTYPAVCSASAVHCALPHFMMSIAKGDYRCHPK
jgi:hypothetical protein